MAGHVRYSFPIMTWWLVAGLLAFCTVVQAADRPEVTFHSPQSGATVSGRSFSIEVQVSQRRLSCGQGIVLVCVSPVSHAACLYAVQVTGFALPDMGKGILLLDGGKLMEVRQQHVTISMDGLGGLSEGQHSLKLVLMRADGSSVDAHGGEVLFVKEGSPEDTAGPFYDDRFDDSALQEMQDACGPLEQQQQEHSKGTAADGTLIIALGMPVLSARKRYDGEEDDDMRVVQARETEGYIQDIADLAMLKVFLPSLVALIPHESRSFRCSASTHTQKIFKCIIRTHTLSRLLSVSYDVKVGKEERLSPSLPILLSVLFAPHRPRPDWLMASRC